MKTCALKECDRPVMEHRSGSPPEYCSEKHGKRHRARLIRGRARTTQLHPARQERLDAVLRFIADGKVWRDGFIPEGHVERDCAHVSHYGPIGETGLEYGITPADHGPHELTQEQADQLELAERWVQSMLTTGQPPQRQGPAPAPEVIEEPVRRCAECGRGPEERIGIAVEDPTWPRCGRKECEDAFRARRSS